MACKGQVYYSHRQQRNVNVEDSRQVKITTLDDKPIGYVDFVDYWVGEESAVWKSNSVVVIFQTADFTALVVLFIEYLGVVFEQRVESAERDWSLGDREKAVAFGQFDFNLVLPTPFPRHR